MKLSQLATKLGLPANTTEAQINEALDAKITLANSAEKVLPILKKW
jgi:2-keto-3-deoxy-L-rhamnonate aldolase RhmA